MKKKASRKKTKADSGTEEMMPRMHHQIVMDFCLYFVTECLQDDCEAQIEKDDPECLKEMKLAINKFLDRHRVRIFGYENFIQHEMRGSVKEAREHVAYVIDVIQEDDQKKSQNKTANPES